MVDVVNKEELINRFTWIDYLVLVFMLAISAAIGIFYGFINKKVTDSKEYLIATRSMSAFPVSMSLIASFISAISLLGIPSEVYQSGFIYWMVSLSFIPAMVTAAFVYMPVFYDLQVTSAFEYLELRFNKRCRKLGSVMYILMTMILMGIVVYAPALALSQVTGIPVYLSVSLITFIALFYTTIGGIKAVLWTDALQLLIMYVSVLFILIKGTVDLGGFRKVWELNSYTGRTRLYDFDPDPRTRHTFWTLVVGGIFTWLSLYGVNQTQVQRYVSVKTKALAKTAIIINSIGFVFLVTTCIYAGMVIHAHYFKCDPLSIGLISKPDQLFPVYVMDHFGKWRGLPGLFVAGIFSGALSTISSGINSLTAIVLEDFLKDGLIKNMTEKKATIISKILSIIFGVLSFLLVFIVENLGDVLSAAYSIAGIVSGPMLAFFSLGMLFPWTNSMGAFTGTISGIGVGVWLVCGNEWAKKTGIIALNRLPVNNCSSELTFDPSGNVTLTEYFDTSYTTLSDDAGPLVEFYKISYLYYSVLGCTVATIVGIAVSLSSGRRNIRTLNPQLLSPIVTWFKFLVPNYDDIGVDYVENVVKLDPRRENLATTNGVDNLALDKNIPRDEITPL